MTMKHRRLMKDIIADTHMIPAALYNQNIRQNMDKNTPETSSYTHDKFALKRMIREFE